MDGFLLKPVSQSVLFDAIMGAFDKEVPVRERAAPARVSTEEELRKIRGARVLLAEDNEINQQVAQEMLERAGLVVSIANNGKEAVQKVKAETYDAVLMDIQMPVMGGIRGDPGDPEGWPVQGSADHRDDGPCHGRGSREKPGSRDERSCDQTH